jgi:hypothetical protein
MSIIDCTSTYAWTPCLRGREYYDFLNYLIAIVVVVVVVVVVGFGRC